MHESKGSHITESVCTSRDVQRDSVTCTPDTHPRPAPRHVTPPPVQALSALEERLHESDGSLRVMRKERNALLASLRLSEREAAAAAARARELLHISPAIHISCFQGLTRRDLYRKSSRWTSCEIDSHVHVSSPTSISEDNWTSIAFYAMLCTGFMPKIATTAPPFGTQGHRSCSAARARTSAPSTRKIHASYPEFEFGEWFD